MASPVPVILDTDPGIDDAVAVALAARAPELHVVGVVTSYGNTDLHRASRNARHVLDLAGAAQVPVLPGAARPLRRPPIACSARHGPEGVGHATVGPSAATAANADAMLDLLRKSAGPATIALLGPPTNLVHAVHRDEDLVRRKVARVISVLGNFGRPAAPGRHADFNAWCDPEAAVTLMGSGIPLELLPLDVAERFTVSQGDITAWQRAPDPLTRWLGAAVLWRLEVAAESTVSLPDVVAVAALLDSRVMTLAERRLSIDLDEGPARGHTRERGGGAAVTVATQVAVPHVRSLLTRMTGASEPAETGEEIP
jgi:pyrimidine-specific ribonucleoside hydrolase